MDSHYPTPPPSASQWSPSQKPFNPKVSEAASYYNPQEPADYYKPASYPLPQSRPESPYQPPEYQPKPSLQHDQQNSYTEHPPRPQSSSKHRPNSFPPSRSPRPSSPFYVHRVPSPYTPYNASRPLPRKGLVRRAWAQVKAIIKQLATFARSHPLATGLISFLPILAGAGIYKAVKSITGLFGSSKPSDKLEDIKENLKDKANDTKATGLWAWGGALKGYGACREWWFDEFTHFGGTKYGPLEGALKILQMLVNHWCKLTPSAIPRTMSILLELYFLDVLKEVGARDDLAGGN